jgi:hypothetical protein
MFLSSLLIFFGRTLDPPLSINDAPLDQLSVHFTGRENELDFVLKALSKEWSGIPSRCAVFGMPGIGKTQLLLRYVKISFHLHRYSHIFWISASSIDKLNQGIAKILDLVEHPDRDRQDQNAKLVAARLWLEEPSTENSSISWLLVIDNVDRNTLDFLRTHLPRTNPRGNILFSTRTADVAEVLVNAEGVKHATLGLRALELQDTANLLLSDAGIHSEAITPALIGQARDLAQHVGCLPLAGVIHETESHHFRRYAGDLQERGKNGCEFIFLYHDCIESNYSSMSTGDSMGKRFRGLRGAIDSSHVRKPIHPIES